MKMGERVASLETKAKYQEKLLWLIILSQISQIGINFL